MPIVLTTPPKYLWIRVGSGGDGSQLECDRSSVIFSEEAFKEWESGGNLADGRIFVKVRYGSRPESFDLLREFKEIKTVAGSTPAEDSADFLKIISAAAAVLKKSVAGWCLSPVPPRANLDEFCSRHPQREPSPIDGNVSCFSDAYPPSPALNEENIDLFCENYPLYAIAVVGLFDKFSERLHNENL